ncbi:MAG: HAD family phosphatase [Lachnospiraceae bacterium]|nr:HAD family phosphatase [Lachnospiraceae bacterium]
MIKNVILDIGNVLGDFQWKELGRECMKLNDEEFELFADAMIHSGLWDEFDKAYMTDAEIIKAITDRMPSLADRIPEFFKRLGDIVLDYDYSCPWIDELHAKGFKVYILSNYGKTAFEEGTKNRLKFVPMVDGKVVSYEVKMVKPNKDIYECLLNRYSLKADECIFFDDRKENIKGAENVGIHGILFQNIDQAKADLEKAIKEFS